jgi:SAM-dependent methyltransferase
MNDRHYWEATVVRLRGSPHEGLWRRYCDLLNGRLLESWMPSGSSARLLKTDLFDEAMGRGLYGALAARAGVVVGQDVACGVLAAARSRYPEFRAAAADVRRLPYAAASFDVIVSNSTLDHLSSRAELEQSLAELFRVLRPGGRLLLTLDNRANPVVAVRNWLPAGWLMALGLIPFRMGATLGPWSAPRLLRRLGFEVRDNRTFMHCPRLPAVALARRLDRRGGPESRERFLRAALAWERLERWPLRYYTGYFIAVLALKPPV